MHNAPRPPAQMPLDQLRWLIEHVDSRIGALETSSAADVMDLLHMLDEMETLFADLSAGDADLRAEAGRRETIHLTLQRKAGVILGRLRPSGGIAAARAKRTPIPPAQDWWWYADAYVARQRQRSLRSFLVTSMIIGVILAVAALAYQTFFRPDPKVIAHMGYVQEAQTAAEQNDFNKALQALERGLVEFPGDGEIHIWQGAMLIRLNRQQEADAAFAAARAAYADEVTYLVSRSQIRLQAGDADGAYSDAQAAVRADPNSARAYLMLGGAQEWRGEVSAASQSYSTAAGLAAARKDSQLEAMAKIRMAMMMQNAPIFPQATAVPTR